MRILNRDQERKLGLGSTRYGRNRGDVVLIVIVDRYGVGVRRIEASREKPCACSC